MLSVSWWLKISSAFAHSGQRLHFAVSLLLYFKPRQLSARSAIQVSTHAVMFVGRLFPGIIKPEGNKWLCNKFSVILNLFSFGLLLIDVVVSSIFSSRLWSRKPTPEPTTASTERSMRPASPSSRPPANTSAMETPCKSSRSSHLSDTYVLCTFHWFAFFCLSASRTFNLEVRQNGVAPS